MASWFPASLAAEAFLTTIAFFLWTGRLPSRILAVGCIVTQVPIWLARQIFWNLDTGTTIGFFYPPIIITVIPFMYVLFTYVALANVFENFGRDIFGRKVKAP